MRILRAKITFGIFREGDVAENILALYLWKNDSDV